MKQIGNTNQYYHVPAKLIYWNEHVFRIFIDEGTINKWDCKNCDAHKLRIPNRRYVNGGICPDNDRDIDWHCDADGIPRILKLI